MNRRILGAAIAAGVLAACGASGSHQNSNPSDSMAKLTIQAKQAGLSLTEQSKETVAAASRIVPAVRPGEVRPQPTPQYRPTTVPPASSSSIPPRDRCSSATGIVNGKHLPLPQCAPE